MGAVPVSRISSSFYNCLLYLATVCTTAVALVVGKGSKEDPFAACGTAQPEKPNVARVS